MVPDFFKGRMLPVVLQQDERLLRDFPRGFPVFRRENFRARPFLRAAVIGIGKQPELVFRLKDSPAGLIDHGLRDFPVRDQFRQILEVGFAHHVHVHAGFQGQFGVLSQIAHAVLGHFADGRIVGDDEALEAPLLSQQVREQPVIGRGRHPVDFIEGTS